MLDWLSPDLLKFATPLGLVLILTSMGFVFSTRVVMRLLSGYERVLNESTNAQREQAAANQAVAIQLSRLSDKVDHCTQKSTCKGYSVDIRGD